jgi:transposase-like protein
MPAGASGEVPNGETMTTDDTTTPDPFAGHIAGKAGGLEAVPGASEPAMGVRQAARALGITREHLYARIRKGQVRAIDGPNENGQGTVRLVPLSEIERLGVETGFRSHGEVKAEPADTRPILQLERVTQQLESTRAVLAEAVERNEPIAAEADAGGWWGRRRREREALALLRARVAEVEAALRSAHAVAGGGETPTE